MAPKTMSLELNIAISPTDRENTDKLGYRDVNPATLQSRAMYSYCQQSAAAKQQQNYYVACLRRRTREATSFSVSSWHDVLFVSFPCIHHCEIMTSKLIFVHSFS
jgi:hypothetical protein